MKNTSIRIFIIIFTAIALFFLVLNFFDIYYGQYFGDFYSQHLNFINYIRMNFYQTKDLFPQFNMNMGLGQSMVTMYYHGLYNPLIMFSFFVPFIPTEIYFGLMIAFIFALTACSSYYLLGYYHLDHRIKLITTTIVTFSGALIYHSHYHPMFIYYLPFAFINLILIHRLVNKNKSALFSVCFSLIFFMNFFFAPMVIIVNSIYFAILVMKRQDKLKKTIKFIVATIIGITIGFLTTLPQFVAFINSSRVGGYNEAPNLYGVNFLLPVMYIINPYILAIGVIGFCALIYFLVKRTNKIAFYIAISVFILSFVDILNYFINVGQYVNYKQLIYVLPLVSILIGLFLNESNKFKDRLIKIVVICSVVFLILVGIVTQADEIKEFLSSLNTISALKYPFIMTSLAIGIILIHYIMTRIDIKRVTNKKIVFLCMSLALCCFALYGAYYKGMWFEPITQATCSDEVMTYTTDTPTNDVECINESTPGYFTSIINSDYLTFFKVNSDMSSYGFERKVNNESFDNYFAQTVFSMNEESYNFIYGQTNENLYDGTTTGVYEMYFYDTVEGAQNQKPVKEPDIVIDEMVLDTYLEVPVEENEGMLVIEMDISEFCAGKTYKNCFIEINGVRNERQIIDHTNLDNNSKTFYFYIDLSEIDNKLVINASHGPGTIKDIKIYYFSPEDLAKKKEVVDIYNLEIDYNNSYSFEIDMPSSGYIITTLPYDSNFDVYVDGVKVENEKVNEAFLGFKVDSGHHEITISYTIQGFYLSLALFVTGIVSVIILALYERRR